VGIGRVQGPVEVKEQGFLIRLTRILVAIDRGIRGGRVDKGAPDIREAIQQLRAEIGIPVRFQVYAYLGPLARAEEIRFADIASDPGRYCIELADGAVDAEQVFDDHNEVDRVCIVGHWCNEDAGVLDVVQ